MVEELSAFTWPSKRVGRALDFGVNGSTLLTRGSGGTPRLRFAGRSPPGSPIDRTHPGKPSLLQFFSGENERKKYLKAVGPDVDEQIFHLHRYHPEIFAPRPLLECVLSESLMLEAQQQRYNPSWANNLAVHTFGPDAHLLYSPLSGNTILDILYIVQASLDVKGSLKPVPNLRWNVGSDILQVAVAAQPAYAQRLVVARCATVCHVIETSGLATSMADCPPLLNTIATSSSRVANVTVSPHMPEIACVSEEGVVALWCPSLPHSMQVVSNMIGTDPVPLSGTWRGCAFTDHPNVLLVGNSRSVALYDVRCQTPGPTVLSSPYIPLCALTAPQSTSCMWAAASNDHVYLMDTRRPCTPVVQWAHHQSNDPPIMLDMPTQQPAYSKYYLPRGRERVKYQADCIMCTLVLSGHRHSGEVVRWDIMQGETLQGCDSLLPLFVQENCQPLHDPLAGGRFPSSVGQATNGLAGLWAAGQSVWMVDIKGQLLVAGQRDQPSTSDREQVVIGVDEPVVGSPSKESKLTKGPEYYLLDVSAYYKDAQEAHVVDAPWDPALIKKKDCAGTRVGPAT
eukprot:Ihof_evm1s881 gene=Ihof_evmTU1s881